jgi:hypothetical protein
MSQSAEIGGPGSGEHAGEGMTPEVADIAGKCESSISSTIILIIA